MVISGSQNAGAERDLEDREDRQRAREAADEEVDEQQRRLGERLVDVVLDHDPQAGMHVPEADRQGQHHQGGVQRALDPVDRETIVAGGELQDGVDHPDHQRDERDGADLFGDPVAGAMLGRAQAARLAERRAIADHQSAPVMLAMPQTASVAATAKAKITTEPALADLTSKARPESQIRWRTPLARWKKTLAVRPSITTLPGIEPSRPLKAA